MEFMKLPQGKLFITSDSEIFLLDKNMPELLQQQLIEDGNGIVFDNFLNQSISVAKINFNFSILPIAIYNLNRFENLHKNKSFIII